MNHEIRFPCENETIVLVKALRKRIAPELMLSYFKMKIFLLGINELNKQILQKEPDILFELMKKTKKGKRINPSKSKKH